MIAVMLVVGSDVTDPFESLFANHSPPKPLGVVALSEATIISTAEVSIVYCRQCQWLLRSAWYSQELLSTFADRIAKLTLVPATGGVFRIEVNGQVIWDRASMGCFPEIKELKRLVRDVAWPGLDLGHIDR